MSDEGKQAGDGPPFEDTIGKVEVASSPRPVTLRCRSAPSRPTRPSASGVASAEESGGDQ